MREAEGDAWAGTLELAMGGANVVLPVLTIAEARPWQAQVEAALAQLGAVDFTRLEHVAQHSAKAWEHVIAAVVAYDKDGRLGGREAIEATATHAQVYAAAREMFSTTYPFVRDVRALLSLVGQVMATAAVAGPTPTAPSLPGPATASPQRRAASKRT